MAGNKQQRGLGRGLDALLGAYEPTQRDNEFAEIELERLYVNPNQPRKKFDQARLEELSGSLKQHGMVQPIVVQRHGERFMIVTGERRYRAAKLAGLATVPVIERAYDDEAIHEIALIENIQREDLNAIEEAAAISFLMKQHDLTQEEVAARLSKSRPAIANTLRLLSLPDTVKEYIKEGALSSGHGRALSSLNNPAQQERLAQQAVQSGCSVRALEQIVKAAAAEEAADEKKAKPAPRKKAIDSDLYEVETRLREKLKTKVQLQGGKKRGKITIEYYNEDTLQEIYDIILRG